MAQVKEITRKLEEIHEKIKADIAWEPLGPTSMPEIPDLRNWDMRLLKTYAPFYAPFCDLCCFCTYGKCDLTETRRGGCGIDIATQQARFVLLACLMGCSAHAAHGGHILEFLIDRHGPDKKIDLGGSPKVSGFKPTTVLMCGASILTDPPKSIFLSGPCLSIKNSRICPP